MPKVTKILLVLLGIVLMAYILKVSAEGNKQYNDHMMCMYGHQEYCKGAR